MVVDTSLYDLLDVQPDASDGEIRRAIQKKSLEHHPDRGGSHEMMQQVNAARQILTDPQKRQLYDRYGLDGIRSRMAEQGSEFRNIFDIFDLIRDPKRSHGSAPSRGSDIKQALKVSLEELYSGSTKTVTVDRKTVCAGCHGAGSQDGTTHECTNCHGAGIETMVYRIGPIIQQMQRTCSSCNGEGRTIDERNRCRKCLGRKLLNENKRVDVHITHGSHNRETIKLNGQGNETPNGASGDVYIILDQQPHPIFNRHGDNLLMKLQINLTESLCGFQRLITLLDGHTILISHPAGNPIVPNTYRCLKGYGMPNRQNYSHGDLIVHFDVTFPNEGFITTERERQQLEALLPARPSLDLKGGGYREEAALMEYDFVEKQETADDDAQFHENAESIPCRAQ